MLDLVFEKSDKGIEEIKSRVFRLEHRLRTLLVLVDGKQNVGELLAKIRGLGIAETSISQLLDSEFIRLAEQPRTQGPRANAMIAPLEPTTLSPDTRMASLVAPLQASVQSEHSVASYQALYTFYNETIKKNLGLRGYMLEVKVEKAGNLQELIDLRRTFYAALKKAKGETTARALLTRLDELIQV